jgi:hypothetical protein
LQAFTAIGHIAGDETYQVEMCPEFHPWRRDITYLDAVLAPIKPLLDQLSFTAGRKNWGFMFRRGHFEINEHDFRLIAASMGVPDRQFG